MVEVPEVVQQVVQKGLEGQAPRLIPRWQKRPWRGSPQFRQRRGEGVASVMGRFRQWLETPGLACQMRVMMKAPIRLKGMMQPTHTQAWEGV